MPYKELEVVYEGYSHEVPLRVPDLSTHGMFVNTPRTFPEGAVLKLKFRLTRTNFPIQARGEVRYCVPGVGIGIEFVDITEEAQEAIADELEMGEAAEARGR
jgi:hypothetical protein